MKLKTLPKAFRAWLKRTIQSLDGQVASLEIERIHLLCKQRGRHIYLAGPMTGIPDHNFPAFNAKAEELRKRGWVVENPAEHGVVEGAAWADYMRWDLTRLATCGSIYLLPGWSKSKGAQLELHIADALGMRMLLDDAAEWEEPKPHKIMPRTPIEWREETPGDMQ